MRKMKSRNTTLENMQNSQYQKLVRPMVFTNERFEQISKYIPEVKDYYYLSNHGRVYSAYSNISMARDLANEYTHTTFGLKNGMSKTFDLREVYFQIFGHYYN